MENEFRNISNIIVTGYTCRVGGGGWISWVHIPRHEMVNDCIVLLILVS